MSPRTREMLFQAIFSLLHVAALLHGMAVAYHVKKLRRAMREIPQS